MNEKLRFEIKAKNNRLHELIYSGHKTLVDFCDLEGLRYYYVCALINLSMSPYCVGVDGNGNFMSTAMRLCEIFGVDPIELFPPEIYGKGQKHEWVVKKNIHQLTMQEARQQIEYVNPKIEIPELKLNRALNSLTEREQKVIKARFGLSGDVPKTLEETGKMFCVTRERIRQIEAKAIRKLRHPSRSGELRDCI